MAFQQGLSGLNISSKALDAVGNNIANAQTVGFKSATSQFADIYASSIGGASSGNVIGQGGSLMAVSQNFTQGNVTSTNNPLDIAINGNGFFRFQPTLDDQTPLYSRNGQLHLDADGYLVNAQDMLLNAFISRDGLSIDQSRAEPLQLSSAQLEPRATGYNSTLAPGTGGIDIGINLDVRDKRADMAGLPAADEWNALETWDFAALNPNMYNYSTSSTVFDQRGEPHVLSMYFVRQGVDDTTGSGIGSSSWRIHYILDSKYEIPYSANAGAVPDANLNFSANGQLDTTVNSALHTLNLAGALDKAGVAAPLDQPPLSFFPDPADPAFPSNADYTMNIDFSSATQFGSSYDVNSLTQDGFGPGRLSGVSIEADGRIQARYTNGETKLMGQVALVTFQNPNGLIPLGNNNWASSASSGQPLVGAPQSGSRGAIQAGAVEDANVDLTQELVSMITLQRSYQANAQTIKTQDQILQTLVNLR